MEDKNYIKMLMDKGFFTDEQKKQIINDFPELAESEDEQIRKWLIIQMSSIVNTEAVKELDKNGYEMATKAIAYLEKQKEEEGYEAIPVESTLEYKLGFKAGKESEKQNDENEECTDFTIYHPLKNGKGKYECIPYSFYGSLTSFSEDKDLIDFLRTCFYTEEECNEWIEQQKEQKPLTIESAYENFVNPETLKEARTNKYIKAQLLWELMHNGIITEVDYQYLTDDKRKPWTAEEYRIAYQKGFDMSEQLKQKEQKPVHTAKEMWKEMRLEVYAQASGNRHEPNYSDDSTKMFSLCDIDEIFEKIGNSTVGSQPAEWSGEDEKMRQSIIKDIEFERNYTSAETGVVIGKYNEQIAWLKSLPLNLKKKNEDVAKLCSNEWSEEDERNIRNFESVLYYDKYLSDETRTELGNFLKSLPNRLNRQPKTEWSEEDEKMLQRTLECLKNGWRKLPTDIKQIESWLKSLRPQPQGIYQQVVKGLRDMCDRYEQNGMFTDERARDFLGNVRVKCKDAIDCAPILDEPSWKPNKEQMEALKDAVRLFKETHFEKFHYKIESLYEQLEGMYKNE